MNEVEPTAPEDVERCMRIVRRIRTAVLNRLQPRETL